ncbi:MAG: hypothetical protein IPJ46_24270 [Anaerolineales bacterium]|nr:hypothetical protein [Anaerolineales bacterium]
MRLLEIVIPLLLAVYLIWPHPRSRTIRFAPSITLILTCLHFAIEGYRWQMIPLYALTLLLAISSFIKNKTENRLARGRFVPDRYPAGCFDSIACPAACSCHHQAERITGSRHDHL